MATQEQQYFVEIFPVQLAALPTLTAYHLQVSAGEPSVMGGKLAYRLRQAVSGNWVWMGGRLLTDATPNPVKLMMALEVIKKEQPTVFGKLVNLEEDYQWRADPALLAEFITRGALVTLSADMRAALTKTAFRLKNARIERDYRAQPWVVNGQPAVSFSVESSLIYDPDLQTYAASVGDTGEIVGLAVADKTSTLRGEVVKVLGKVEEQRQRLESLSQRQVMRDLIHNAPGDHLVVRVASGQYEYDYVASTLEVVIRLDDAHRFNVNPRQAAKALTLNPGQSAQMVKVVADVPKKAGLVANAYSTQNAPDLFAPFSPSFDVVFGGNRTRPYSAAALVTEVTANGLYWWRERFLNDPIRIGLINTLGDVADDFLEAMKRVLERAFGFKIDVVRERKVRVVSQPNLESAVRVIQKETLDVVMVFSGGDQDELDVGRYVKAQTVGRGMPCLVIDQSKLDNPDTMTGVLMGMLARAGNVPYLLDEPLPYTDFVVGLSFIRESKKDGDEITGMVRVYRNDGALLYYFVNHAPLERGEGIPQTMLATLFPAEYFAGKRILIHHDGRMARETLWALGGWEDEIDATFYPVEIVQREVPILYAMSGGKIEAASWGSTFRFGDSEALLMTAVSPNDYVPLPLYVRTEPPLTIDQALHSVQAFALLHYDNALQTPRLPVTLHHADTIAASVLRGVLPDVLTGDTPFWL